MDCSVRWTGDGMSFIAETGSGHLVTMDGAPDGGGRNLAPRPMEMVLVGTGGCAAYDVVLILQRGRHPVRGCEVKLMADRAPDDPKVFTRIEMQFTVRGKDAESRCRVARGAAIARKILFGDRDARKDGRNYALGADR